MATVYVEVDTILTGKINLVRGKQEDEEITLYAAVERDGKTEVKPIKQSITLTGKEVAFEWNTKDLVKKEEMFLPVKLILSVGKPGGSPTQWKSIPVVLYRSALELLAVDEDNKPVAGVECKLIIQVDEGFASSKRKWREDYTIGSSGAKEWTRKTGADGKIAFSELPLGSARLEFSPPYALRPYGWKTEGEFTETGAKRKAEIRKLPVVHYIWWGNPTAEGHLVSATATPNDMADIKEKDHVMVYRGCGFTFANLPKVLVNVWRQADAVALSSRLHRDIIQRPIAKLSELMTEDGFAIHPVFMGRGRQLDSILDTLTKYKFFSAAKDLISLCVMFKYGGFYFDTTTLLPVDGKDATPDTFVPEPTEIRLPSTAGGGGSYSFYRHDASIFSTVFANTERLDEARKFWTANLDVWAMYSPPKHPAIAMMIDSYLNRCASFGFESHPTTTILDLGDDLVRGEKWVWKKEWNGKTFHEFVTQVCQPADKDPGTSARNNIIGNLIIASVQEGLTNYVFEFQNKPVPNESDVKTEIGNYLWKTKAASAEVKAKYAPAKVQAYLAEFNNLPKAHSGSWRVTSSAAVPSPVPDVVPRGGEEGKGE